MDAIIAKLKSQRTSILAEVTRIDRALVALTGGTTPAVAVATATATATTKTGRKRRKMTPAQKRAVSERMKKSWAARKKKAAKAAKAANR